MELLIIHMNKAALSLSSYLRLLNKFYFDGIFYGTWGLLKLNTLWNTYSFILASCVAKNNSYLNILAKIL